MGVTRSVKVGPKGRVVIPAWAREEIGIEEGDELAVVVLRGEVRLMPREQLIRQLRGRLKADHSVVDELIAERRAEASRDAADI